MRDIQTKVNLYQDKTKGTPPTASRWLHSHEIASYVGIKQTEQISEKLQQKIE